MDVSVRNTFIHCFFSLSQCMKSALMPLRLSFATASQHPPYTVVYKNGDDLRQVSIAALPFSLSVSPG